jgi:recombination protein RecA
MSKTVMDSFPLLPDSNERNADSAISTGLANVDEMLGVGGLPRGRVVEIFGPPDCGKTTLALNWISAAQEQGATVVYVDVERKFDAPWAAACGVNLQELVTIVPDSGSQAVAMLEALLRTFSVDLAVIDSAAALVSDEELETSLDDTPAEMQSEFLARSLRRLHGLAERSQCCLLFLNQTRMADADEGTEKATGGPALALHSAIRIRLHPGLTLTGGDSRIRQIGLMTVKNKLWEPFLESSLELRGSTVSILEKKKPGRETPLRRVARSGVDS